MIEECSLCCMTPCDPLVDAAVLRVHLALRDRLAHLDEEPAKPVRTTGEKWPGVMSVPKGRPGGRVYVNGRSDVTLEGIRGLLPMSIVGMAKALKCSPHLIRERLKREKVQG